MMKLLMRFAKDTHGGTVIEYALIASGLAILTVAAVKTIGVETNQNFTDVANSFPAP